MAFIAIEPMTVKVTVDETSITDIELDGNKESVAMVRSVKEYMIPRMLDLQSIGRRLHLRRHAVQQRGQAGHRRRPHSGPCGGRI